MKFKHTLIILFLWTNAFSQDFPMDSETQKITYTDVVSIPGVSKNEFSARAKKWATFNKYVKKLDSPAEGKYIVTGTFKVKYPAPMVGFFHEGIVKYKLSVFSKEGKYKYEITDLVHESNRGNGGPLEKDIPECGKFTLVLNGWSSIKNQTKTEIPKVVESLKEAMLKKAAPAKKNDLDF